MTFAPADFGMRISDRRLTEHESRASFNQLSLIRIPQSEIRN
jgi:hypothetical protein